MHRAIVVLCALVLLLATLAAGDVGNIRVVGKSIVTNGTFERVGADGSATGWSMPAEVYAVDDQVAHEGQRSLRADNRDPKQYLLAAANVPCEKGKRYAVSAWIKTEAVEGEDSGATLCLEWTDKDGKWLGGFYPPGIKGTNDWTYFEHVSSPLPEGAASCTVVAYLRQGMTGRAWFDDIQVREAREPYLRLNLLRPAYRGLVFQGDEDQAVSVRAILAPDEALALKDMKLEMTVVPAGATEAIARKTVAGPEKANVDLTLDLPDARVGDYVVRAALLDAAGKEAGAAEYPIRVVPGSVTQRLSYVDQHGRLIREGKPFFPLGLYFGTGPKDESAYSDVDLVGDSPFNCIMNYGINGGSLDDIRAYLDHLSERGVKIIYLVKDLYAGSAYEELEVGPFKGEEAVVKGLVNEFKDHPAVLGWYLNDELPLSFLPRLEQHQKWVSELDPDHPTWVVLYQVEDLESYLTTTDVDLGVDPYPVAANPIRQVSDWTDRTRAAIGPHRGMWIVPQIFAWNCYRSDDQKKDDSGRAPTFEEKRNMAWQAIIHGANGLVFYSFFDLKRGGDFDNQWAEVKRMGDEVRRLTPAILSAEDAPSVDAGNQAIHCATRSLGGKLYLFAANVSNRPQLARFALPGKATLVRPLFEGRESVKPDRQGFRDVFQKLEVHLYGITMPKAAQERP